MIAHFIGLTGRKSLGFGGRILMDQSGGGSLKPQKFIRLQRLNSTLWLDLTRLSQPTKWYRPNVSSSKTGSEKTSTFGIARRKGQPVVGLFVADAAGNGPSTAARVRPGGAPCFGPASRREPVVELELPHLDVEPNFLSEVTVMKLTALILSRHPVPLVSSGPLRPCGMALRSVAR
jgi:hypothetical protein